MQSRSFIGAAFSCLLLALSPASGTMLEPGWSEAVWLTTGVPNVTGMAWAPDGSGRLFLTSKGGQIRIVTSGPPPATLPTPFATVTPIYTFSECGLIGIAFDPDFLHNGHVYVFATVSITEQQIIRYTAVGNVGTDKTIVIPGLPTAGANHDGGGVGFGPDGKLYWSIGDNGNSTGVNADLVSLASKVGRANANGTIPVDNPFVDGPGPNNDYIFARGLRNPFTLTFQPTTGKLWVDVAGTLYEQVFAVSMGDHAGYNTYENTQPAGFIPPSIVYRTNGIDTRSITATGASRSGGVVTFTTTAAHGFRQGGKITVSGVTDPSFNGTFYVTSVPTTSTFTVLAAGPETISGGGSAVTTSLGGAITGGTFYDATGAPPAYHGNFFFGDYNSGRINRATVGPGTTVTQVDYFASGHGGATDVSVGPDGALYYVTLSGNVLRASYNATVQDLIVSNMHLFMNEGRSVAFTVRLAVAPAADVAVDVARTAGSAGIDVASGAVLIFTPSNFSIPQTVVLASTEDADILDDASTFTVSSSGLTPQSVDVSALDTSGASGSPAPGGIPDGDALPGIPLTLAIDADDPTLLDLDWGAACGVTALDYSVHEGTLGAWYSHDAILCTTGGQAKVTILPLQGDRYFVVVPLDAPSEGSYGKDSTGAERPRSDHACRPERDITPCP